MWVGGWVGAWVNAHPAQRRRCEEHGTEVARRDGLQVERAGHRSVFTLPGRRATDIPRATGMRAWRRESNGAAAQGDPGRACEWHVGCCSRVWWRRGAGAHRPGVRPGPVAGAGRHAVFDRVGAHLHWDARGCEPAVCPVESEQDRREVSARFALVEVECANGNAERRRGEGDAGDTRLEARGGRLERGRNHGVGTERGPCSPASEVREESSWGRARSGEDEVLRGVAVERRRRGAADLAVVVGKCRVRPRPWRGAGNEVVSGEADRLASNTGPYNVEQQQALCWVRLA